MKELPKDIQDLLVQNAAPMLLERHLTIVYNVGIELTIKLMQAWPNLNVVREEILFGTATHDIGKMFETNELGHSGNLHEQVGYEFLVRQGIPENLARFAKTHGDWRDENLKVEDLIVSLADKIWKGKRIDELEERLATMISKDLDLDYWDVTMKLDSIISRIIIGADKRLNWQSGSK